MVSRSAGFAEDRAQKPTPRKQTPLPEKRHPHRRATRRSSPGPIDGQEPVAHVETVDRLQGWIAGEADLTRESPWGGLFGALASSPSRGASHPRPKAPNPAQAMTVIRAMRRANLRRYDPDALSRLLDVLSDLLQGDVRSFQGLSPAEHRGLDALVGRIFRETGTPTPGSPDPDQNDGNEVVFQKLHVMLMLRAINGMNTSRFDATARERVKKVKWVLHQVSRRRMEALHALIRSDDPDDQVCCRILFEGLFRAYREAENYAESV